MPDSAITINRELAEFWPFFAEVAGQRSPLEAIDSIAVEVSDPVALSIIEASLQPQFVEDVLESFLNRLSKCLELREKAHAIQASEVQNASLLRALQANAGPAHEIAYLEDLKRFGLLNGHGLNYRERFHYLRSLFSENLKQAVARAKVAAQGLDSIYGIQAPALPAPTVTGYLDQLTLWGQQISDALHLELQQRRIIIVPYSFRAVNPSTSRAQIFSEADWLLKLAARDFSFSLDQAHLTARAGNEPRIRRIVFDVTATGQPNRMWLGELQITDGGNVKRSPVALSAGGREIAELHGATTEFYNVSPLGQWQLSFDEKTLDAWDGAMVNITMYLTVSAKPS